MLATIDAGEAVAWSDDSVTEDDRTSPDSVHSTASVPHLLSLIGFFFFLCSIRFNKFLFLHPRDNIWRAMRFIKGWWVASKPGRGRALRKVAVGRPAPLPLTTMS